MNSWGYERGGCSGSREDAAQAPEVGAQAHMPAVRPALQLPGGEEDARPRVSLRDSRIAGRRRTHPSERYLGPKDSYEHGAAARPG